MGKTVANAAAERTVETRRPWLSAASRANLAVTFGCALDEVDDCLDARERMDAYIAERREREYPVGGGPRW